MKTDSLGQSLGESLNNAESWIRQAEQQFLVAEAIASNVRMRGTSEESSLLSVGYLKATVLLLALAIENSFKAVKASRHQLEVNTKGLKKSARGGGPTGHSLATLADEVGIALSADQLALLDRLTQIGIWAGKYHTPIHHEEFERANVKDPRSLTLPSDISTVKGLLLEAARIAGVPPVVA